MRTVIVRGGLMLAVALALALPASAEVTDQKIKAAIQYGLSFTKKSIDESKDEGQLALAGLAMLEAGVEPADESIQRIARRVRATAVTQSKTYHLALSIMFLDRMGLDVDSKLVQSMAVRLIAGQYGASGWSYDCPGPNIDEVNRLQGALNEAVLKGGTGPPKIKASKPAEDAAKSTQVDPDIAEMVRNPRKHLDYSKVFSAASREDNSNTQFAILGLWAARRHGVPVENCLSNTERRFRMTQVNGGWWYTATEPAVTPSMTCAGLLGLAVGIGHKFEQRRLKGRVKLNPDGSIAAGPAQAPAEMPDPLKDPNVLAGYRYLVNSFAGRNGMAADEFRDNLYLMWSLERVCMVYGWAKLGNLDWHIWGADRILSQQNADGGWGGSANSPVRTSNIVNTSFAIMFLCRANLVKDLTGMFRKLKGDKGAGDVKPSVPKEGGGIAKNQDPKNPGTSNNSATATELDPAAMTKDLTLASGAKQAELIKQYTDKAGSAYTQALLDAIPDLSDEARKIAREGLAQRMSRMTAVTLRKYLAYDNPEARRAAAYGAAYREEKELIPDLIAALGDREDLVVRAARVALRRLSDDKEDFGPPPGASEDQKKEAMAGWTAWMKKQK
jgi:hypothetical protein